MGGAGSDMEIGRRRRICHLPTTATKHHFRPFVGQARFILVFCTECLPIMADHPQWDAPPEMQIDTDAVYEATIETSKGTIEAELYPEHAPRTVNNFAFLADEGFYDQIGFHRVIEGFMVQGGDPTGTGRGGPGYQFDDEIEGNPLTHETGVLSMANAGPNTNGSQFFITRAPQSHLDGKHTVFGDVVEGQDVVDDIEEGDMIESVTVEKR